MRSSRTWTLWEAYAQVCSLPHGAPLGHPWRPPWRPMLRCVLTAPWCTLRAPADGVEMQGSGVWLRRQGHGMGQGVT